MRFVLDIRLFCFCSEKKNLSILDFGPIRQSAGGNLSIAAQCGSGFVFWISPYALGVPALLRAVSERAYGIGNVPT